jgi:hypothetical protein
VFMDSFVCIRVSCSILLRAILIKFGEFKCYQNGGILMKK